MPVTIKELSTPDLQQVWEAAKKQAEQKAQHIANDAKKDEQRALTTIAQAKCRERAEEPARYKEVIKKCNTNLGKALANWPNLYPDLRALEKEKGRIDAMTQKYLGQVKSGKLDASVAGLLTQTLEKVASDLEHRYQLAEAALKKQHPPWTVLQLDLAPKLHAEAPRAAQLIDVQAVPIMVLFDDPVLINQLEAEGHPHLLQAMKDAALEELLGALTDWLNAAARRLVNETQRAASLPEYQRQFQEQVTEAVKKAEIRAAGVLEHEAHAHVEHGKFKMRARAELALTAVGLVASALAVASSPLTMGVHGVLGLLALAKAVDKLATDLQTMWSEAEQIAQRLTEKVLAIQGAYENAGKGQIGATELAKTVFNTAGFPWLNTIGGCGKDCGVLQDKVRGLEIDTSKLSKDLNELLEEQDKVQQSLQLVAKLVEQAPQLSHHLEKLEQTVERSAEHVNGLIENIIKLDERVKINTARLKELTGVVQELASREPTWAKVGESLVKLAAISNALHGNFESLQEIHKFAEIAHGLTGTLENVHKGYEEIEKVRQHLPKP